MTPAHVVGSEFAVRVRALGFTATGRQERSFEIALVPDVSAGVTLAFSHAHLPRGWVSVDPVVYVSNWTVSNIVASLLGEAPGTFARATLGERLRYLAPRSEESWDLNAANDLEVDRVVSSVIGKLQVSGLPWMNSMKALSALGRAILTSPPNPATLYTRPVWILLLEGSEQAMAEMDSLAVRATKAWGRAPKDVDAYAEAFRAYASKSHPVGSRDIPPR